MTYPVVVYNYVTDTLGLWYGQNILYWDENNKEVWPFVINLGMGSVYLKASEFAEEWIVVGDYT